MHTVTVAYSTQCDSSVVESRVTALRVANTHGLFTGGRAEGAASTDRASAALTDAHIDDEGAGSATGEHEADESDEWSPTGAPKVRKPDHTGGRGSFNPLDTKTFSELLKDVNPVPLETKQWKCVKIEAQKTLLHNVHIGSQTVPKWVIFTEHGMACRICR